MYWYFYDGHPNYGYVQISAYRDETLLRFEFDEKFSLCGNNNLQYFGWLFHPENREI